MGESGSIPGIWHNLGEDIAQNPGLTFFWEIQSILQGGQLKNCFLIQRPCVKVLKVEIEDLFYICSSIKTHYFLFNFFWSSSHNIGVTCNMQNQLLKISFELLDN